MKTETFEQWKERTRKQPTKCPTKEAKGLKAPPYKGSSHMNTKSPSHVYWEDEKKPEVQLRKAEAV